MTRHNIKPTDPDVIAEEMGAGHFNTHGDPRNWTHVGTKVVNATQRGIPQGTKKVYEVYTDEFGRQVEFHYFLYPDGTTSTGKIAYPGTTVI